MGSIVRAIDLGFGHTKFTTVNAAGDVRYASFPSLALASVDPHTARPLLAPRRTVSLELLDGPGTPEVLGDEARLRQVLGNLVMNAVQHTPETGGITVRVGTVDGDAVLEVCDQGPGLSAEDAHRIFERFYRTDSSRTRTSGGTGLGLSIVDSLVRAHGGVVTVTTSPGQGCRFTVRLPRIGGAAGSAESADGAEGGDDLGLSLVE